MIELPMDLRPLMRELERGLKRGVLSRHSRSGIVRDLVNEYCDLRNKDHNDADDARIIKKHLGLVKLTKIEFDRLIESADRIYHHLDEMVSHWLDTERARDVRISAAFHRDIAVLSYMSEDSGLVSHDEAIEMFDRWLRQVDEESFRPVPREFFELIDKYRSEQGWVK